VRLAAIVAAPVLGLALLVGAVWQARRRATPDAIACQLDASGTRRAHPHRCRSSGAEHGSALTDGLAVLAVADASGLAAGVPADRVAPLRLARGPFLTLPLSPS